MFPNDPAGPFTRTHLQLESSSTSFCLSQLLEPSWNRPRISHRRVREMARLLFSWASAPLFPQLLCFYALTNAGRGYPHTRQLLFVFKALQTAPFGRASSAARGPQGQRGCCWVMQWRVPSPRTRSRQAMPTAARPGKRLASLLRATRSLGSLKVGTSTRRLAM
jgi:hypothetical protein